MIKNFTLYPLALTGFLVGLTACGSKNNSVKDDWPGINEIRIQNEGPSAKSLETSFNLNSKISLPKIGKDVSFTLVTTCERGLLPSSEKQKTFEKTFSYPASEKVIESLEVVDHLPAEVLIYPEFFPSCSFAFKAENQNGSTQASMLSDVKFHDDEARRVIKVTPKDLISEETSYPYSHSQLKNLEGKLPDGFPIKNSKLLCFSNKLNTSEIFQPETKIILGSHFRLPSPTTDVPVEHCIIKGEHTDYDKDGQTILSNRFSILNGDVDSTARIQLVDTITDLKPNRQFMYSKARELDVDLIRLKINNNSMQNVYFEFEANSGIGDVHVVHKLIKTSKPKPGLSPETFKIDYGNKQFPARYTWSDESNNILDETVHVEIDEEKMIVLSAQPQFLCRAIKAPDFIDYELGFVFAPQKDSSFLKFRQVTENEFLKDIIKEGNIFDLYSLRSGLKTNMPEGDTGELRDSTAFQYFFRNSNTYRAKPLELSFTESPASRALNNVHEPTAEMLKSSEWYTFQTYMHDQITCSAEERD